MHIGYFLGSMVNPSSINRKIVFPKLPLHGLLNIDTVEFVEISMEFIFSWTIKCVMNLCSTRKIMNKKNIDLKGLTFV